MVEETIVSDSMQGLRDFSYFGSNCIFDFMKQYHQNWMDKNSSVKIVYNDTVVRVLERKWTAMFTLHGAS